MTDYRSLSKVSSDLTVSAHSSLLSVWVGGVQPSDNDELSIPRLFVNIAINFSSSFCLDQHSCPGEHRMMLGVSAHLSGGESVTDHRLVTTQQARDGFRPTQESKSCLSGYPPPGLSSCHNVTWMSRVLSRDTCHVCHDQ